ncbi:MAG: hypothetical protein U0517_01705 [Candidatus Andersenbacteria bacterium]
MIENVKDQVLLLATTLSQRNPFPTGGGTGNPPTGGGTGNPVNCPAGQVCPPSNLPTGSLEGIVTNVINWGLGIAGTVAVLMLVVGGFMYITAAGDERRLDRAKAIVRGAITGVIIILISAIIVNTLNYALFRGTTP